MPSWVDIVWVNLITSYYLLSSKKDFHGQKPEGYDLKRRAELVSALQAVIEVGRNP